MKINEVSKLTGLKQGTIRLYEDRGLVVPDTEEKNGRLWRDYSMEDVEQLEVVSGLRKALFSIEQIKLMIDDPTLIPALVDAHKRKVDTLSRELDELKAALDSIEETPASAAALKAQLDATSARRMPLPRADIHPRFRYLDELYPPTGTEDAGRLRLPPQVKFFTPLYFTLLPFIIGAAVLVCIAFVRGGFGPRTVDYGMPLIRYICEEVDGSAYRRMWEYHEQNDGYGENYRAYLTLDESADRTIWMLVDMRAPFDEAHTVRIRRVEDHTDGSVKYYRGFKEEIPAAVSSQKIDQFIHDTLAFDRPKTSRDVVAGIGYGLLVVLAAHLIWFGSKVGIGYSLYQAAHTKAANAGYEAANFIDDPDHVYGPTDRNENT